MSKCDGKFLQLFSERTFHTFSCWVVRNTADIVDYTVLIYQSSFIMKMYFPQKSVFQVENGESNKQCKVQSK